MQLTVREVRILAFKAAGICYDVGVSLANDLLQKLAELKACFKIRIEDGQAICGLAWALVAIGPALRSNFQV